VRKADIAGAIDMYQSLGQQLIPKSRAHRFVVLMEMSQGGVAAGVLNVFESVYLGAVHRCCSG
jgi:hypothetical protein